MNLAVIPARGGSKRIPGKNIRNFIDKPMIAYSIEAARRTELFDKIIVSTDSQEIADVAFKYGADVPFMRPADISDDFTPNQKVLTHALEFMSKDVSYDYMCCIYATAPLVSTEYIKKGYKLIKDKNVNTVFSLASFPHPIQRAYKKNEDGTVQMFWPEHSITRSNDLPESFHDAGQFYWMNVPNFLNTGKMISKPALPLILPRYMVVDIDTMEDWEVAEFTYEACKDKGLL